MAAGEILTLVSIVSVILLTIVGGIIRHLLGKLAVAEALVDAKQETIEELRRQNDRLEITAQIQDKFFSALPRTLDPGSSQSPRRGNT